MQISIKALTNLYCVLISTLGTVLAAPQAHAQEYSDYVHYPEASTAPTYQDATYKESAYTEATYSEFSYPEADYATMGGAGSPDGSYLTNAWRGVEDQNSLGEMNEQYEQKLHVELTDKCDALQSQVIDLLKHVAQTRLAIEVLTSDINWTYRNIGEILHPYASDMNDAEHDAWEDQCRDSGQESMGSILNSLIHLAQNGATHLGGENGEAFDSQLLIAQANTVLNGPIRTIGAELRRYLQQRFPQLYPDGRREIEMYVSKMAHNWKALEIQSAALIMFEANLGVAIVEYSSSTNQSRSCASVLGEIDFEFLMKELEDGTL